MIREIINIVQEKLFRTGVYIDVKMADESYKKLKGWMEDNIPDLIQNHDQHCTIIYSKGSYDVGITPKKYEVETKFKQFELFGPENDTLVVEIDSIHLKDRNTELTKKYGFVSDFPEYKPHFTLAYDATIDVSTLPPIEFPIFFENETVTPLKSDWKPKE